MVCIVGLIVNLFIVVQVHFSCHLAYLLFSNQNSIHNSILTWDNLQRRGFSGPGICSLCWSDEEIVDHLFSYCSVWKTMAVFICDFFNIPDCFTGASSADIIKDWVGKFPKSSPLFLLPYNMMWTVWKARNLAVFEGKKRNIHGIIQQILPTVQDPFLGTVAKKG